MGTWKDFDSTSFEAVKGLLSHRGQKKIGNNTYLRLRDDVTIGLQYHRTDVIKFTPDGLTLDSGGWRTVTTKERMNWGLAQLGIHLFTDRGVWYLTKGPDWYNRKDAIPYYDGIRLTYTGDVLAEQAEQDAELEHRQGILKLIDRYVKGFTWEKVEGNSPKSDCWDCSMHVKEEGVPNEDAKTLGDISNSDHLLLHLEEQYYMFSLTYNAFRYAGYNHNAALFWIAPGYRKIHDLRTVKRMLRNYFKGQLLDRTGKRGEPTTNYYGVDTEHYRLQGRA